MSPRGAHYPTAAPAAGTWSGATGSGAMVLRHRPLAAAAR